MIPGNCSSNWVQKSHFVNWKSQEQGTYDLFDQSQLTNATQIVNIKNQLPVDKCLCWFHKQEKT